MSDQPTEEQLAAPQVGEWIEVMFKCSGFDYGQVVRNDPENKQVFVRWHEQNVVYDISYQVGIRLIPSPLIQLALQADEKLVTPGE